MKRVLFLMAALLTAGTLSSCSDDPMLEPATNTSETIEPANVQRDNIQPEQQFSTFTKKQRQ